MTKLKELPELSRAELDLMRILWDGKRLSAREIHESLGDAYDWAYSTTRTMLERMVMKGHLSREPFHGVLLYSPRLSRPQGLARMVRDFADRVLQTDRGSVVALFARSSELTPSEIKELSRLLDEDRGSKP